MQAIVKGQESTVANPLLQLFARDGEVMADIFSGSYEVFQLPTDYTSAPTSVAGPTTIDTVAHKLGTGRYAVLSTDTSAWALGSYKVVMTFKMESGGPDHINVMPFELLDPNVFSTGATYRGYARTSHLIREGYVSSSVATGRLQAAIHRISRQVEEWTKGRIFEHRYMTVRLNGQQARTMLLPHSIIAIDTIRAVSTDATGVEQSYSYEASSFKAFNRHMDGVLSPDDRFNPKVSLVNAFTEPTLIDTWLWPYGHQNVEFTGLFGYVDPTLEAAPARHELGVQPPQIEHVVGVLAYRHLTDPTMSGGGSVHNPGLVKKYQTRHQTIEFYGASGNVSYTGYMSGDPMIDNILAQYAMPITAKYADRE